MSALAPKSDIGFQSNVAHFGPEVPFFTAEKSGGFWRTIQQRVRSIRRSISVRSATKSIGFVSRNGSIALSAPARCDIFGRGGRRGWRDYRRVTTLAEDDDLGRLTIVFDNVVVAIQQTRDDLAEGTGISRSGRRGKANRGLITYFEGSGECCKDVSN